MPDLGTCWTECHDGYYQTAQNECQACNAECDTCLGPNNNQCETCPSGKYFHNNLRTCVTACPPGTYLKSGTCFGKFALTQPATLNALHVLEEALITASPALVMESWCPPSMSAGTSVLITTTRTLMAFATHAMRRVRHAMS